MLKHRILIEEPHMKMALDDHPANLLDSKEEAEMKEQNRDGHRHLNSLPLEAPIKEPLQGLREIKWLRRDGLREFK